MGRYQAEPAHIQSIEASIVTTKKMAGFTSLFHLLLMSWANYGFATSDFFRSNLHTILNHILRNSGSRMHRDKFRSLRMSNSGLCSNIGHICRIVSNKFYGLLYRSSCILSYLLHYNAYHRLRISSVSPTKKLGKITLTKRWGLLHWKQVSQSYDDACAESLLLHHFCRTNV
jgi:hypothetical protein